MTIAYNQNLIDTGAVDDGLADQELGEYEIGGDEMLPISLEIITRLGVGGPWKSYGIFADKRPVYIDTPRITTLGVGGPWAWPGIYADKSPAGASGAEGSVAYVNLNDFSTAACFVTITGSSATTNTDDVGAATAVADQGGLVTGYVAYTNLDDTAAAVASITLVGTSATTNADDTVSAVAATTLVGTVAYTNANDTSNATGSATDPTATGTVAYANLDDTSAAVGRTTLRGSVAATNINDAGLAYVTVNDGIIVEVALTTGVSAEPMGKKPGIPAGTVDWLKTTIELITGRRGNRIAVPPAQTLTFSATPTQAECEALYSYTNDVRDSLEKIINRLDG